MKTVPILGVDFAALTFDEAVQTVMGFLAGEGNRVVVTPNPEGVMQARRNPTFAAALQAADLRLADGTGIVLAARYKRRPLPMRVRGVDLALALFAGLSQRGEATTVYLLGGAPGVAQQAKQRLEAMHPHLQVVGMHHGFFNATEEAKILDEIRTLHPDMLLVCLGMPRQEIWAATHRALPVKTTLCLGGTLDIIAGTAKLAPPRWRAMGLEWLYRLLSQPARWRRMLDIPRFVFAVLLNRQ